MFLQIRHAHLAPNYNKMKKMFSLLAVALATTISVSANSAEQPKIKKADVWCENFPGCGGSGTFVCCGASLEEIENTARAFYNLECAVW